MSNFTNKELLVRIDERQQQIMREIKDMKRSLQGKVANDDDYKDMKEKVYDLWDWKTKVIAQVTIVGAIIGALAGMIGDWVWRKITGQV